MNVSPGLMESSVIEAAFPSPASGGRAATSSSSAPSAGDPPAYATLRAWLHTLLAELSILLALALIVYAVNI
jgi:hypothetical protein